MNKENCLICGTHKPPGHVRVYEEGGIPFGRICSAHTLKQVALDKKERFLLKIELTEEGLEWLEKARK